MKVPLVKPLLILNVILNGGCQVILAHGWIEKVSWKITGTCSGKKINLYGETHNIPQLSCSAAELTELDRYYEIEISNPSNKGGKWKHGAQTVYPPHWFRFQKSEPVVVKLVNGRVIDITREVPENIEPIR